MNNAAVNRRRCQVLFIQGGGAGTHDEWDDKLVANLERNLGPDYEIQYPRMPNESDPRYDKWKASLERQLATLDDDAILVGHSIGGTILVNVLAAQPTKRKFGALFLVSAPFVGEGGWRGNDFETPREIAMRLDGPVYVYHGLDDATAPPAHADLYRRAIPQARVHRLPGRDHQLGNDLGEVARAIRSLGVDRGKHP